MFQDIRNTALFEEAHQLIDSLLQRGSELNYDACETHASPDGKQAVFSCVFLASTEAYANSRILLGVAGHGADISGGRVL